MLGAGCAGLSLAVHLLDACDEAACDPPVIALIEPRHSYARDRTFCLWTLERHPFEAAVSHRWSSWETRHAGRTVRRSAQGLAYVELDAGRFYDLALERLGRSPRVRIERGVSALEHSSGSKVACSDGVVRRAARVFDTRPPSLERAVPPHEIRMIQHFEGWHVRTRGPVFDPSVARLMDFDVPQSPPVHFLYVLPYAPDEALVEATWFTPAVFDATVCDARYAEALERYLRERLAVDSYEILRRERGVLPMSTETFAARNPAFDLLGLAGGLAKPSTGYAFAAIQRQSAQLARALCAAWKRAGRDALAQVPIPPARDVRAATMDRVFLQYMARDPAKTPALLHALFERVEPDVLVRFLSDQADARDALAVMRCVPALAFARETLTAIPAFARRRGALTPRRL